jgi:hypothetical protein
MEFLVMLLAGFPWKITRMARHGISGNAIGCYNFTDSEP